MDQAAAEGSHGMRRHEVAEHASLAEHVYHSDVPGGTGPVPDGYRLVQRYPPNGGQSETGFQAAAYETPEGNIVIAYRGTDDGGDILADVGVGESNNWVGSTGLGKEVLDAQLKEAAAFTDSVIAQHQTAEVTTTGHSLGGFISQVESARTGKDGHAFNAPGAKEYIDKENLPGTSDFHNHDAELDVVSEVGPQYGETHVYEVNDEGPLASHGVEQLAEALANKANPVGEPSLVGGAEPGLGPSVLTRLKQDVAEAQEEARELGEELESGAGEVSQQDVYDAHERAEALEQELEAARQGESFTPGSADYGMAVPLAGNAPSSSPTIDDSLAGIREGLARLSINLGRG